jgi:hypothetical protein
MMVGVSVSLIAKVFFILSQQHHHWDMIFWFCVGMLPSPETPDKVGRRDDVVLMFLRMFTMLILALGLWCVDK